MQAAPQFSSRRTTILRISFEVIHHHNHIVQQAFFIFFLRIGGHFYVQRITGCQSDSLALMFRWPAKHAPADRTARRSGHWALP